MGKKTDRNIEISIWIIMSLLLFIFVPRRRLREASVSFLFKQIITWLFGLLVVERDYIRYPHRLFFQKAIKSSFTFEYYIYPALCVLFNLYYPEERNKWIKFFYYFAHTSFITVSEMFFERYTKLIRYKKWDWYWTFSTIWITYYLSNLFYKWFFRKSNEM